MAGTHSGSGKTTVATGLMAALVRRGLTVAGAKVGPDFIDPGYHSLATGRPGRNLDEWICGSDAIRPLASRASAGCDVLVVEGVMGLFDGAAVPGPESSTASVARLLEAPVILVVDASAIGASVVALVDGYVRHAAVSGVTVAGVVLNKVGSTSHADILEAALASSAVPVLGCLARDDRFVWRDRHLGLVPVVEQPDDVARSVDILAATVAGSLDLEAIVGLARAAPPVSSEFPEPARPAGRCRIAVASGRAFSFAYTDNLERLEEAGAELAYFDPLRDSALPETCDALYAGGGFPETFAPELSANVPLRRDVRSRVEAGLVTWAECGGLAWLSTGLDGLPMCAAVPTAVSMSPRLTLGYRTALTTTSSPVAPAGSTLRGHEFHYSVADPSGDTLVLDGRNGRTSAGFAGPSLLASYLHLHLGADPGPAERFVASSRIPRTSTVPA